VDATERQFLDAIERNPRDVDTRRVYADWLEQHGELDKARFVRAGLAIGELSSADPSFAEKQRDASNELRETLPRTDVAWRACVSQERVTCSNASCTMRWDELSPTATARVRRCGGCGDEVHYGETTVHRVARAARLPLVVVVDEPVDVEIPHRTSNPPPPVIRAVTLPLRVVAAPFVALGRWLGRKR
jgi:uncharacterized protein (TIGR02996 family)